MEKVAMISLALCLFGMVLYATFRMGQREERYKYEWKCLDCGEICSHLKDRLCRDCWRRYWGEMSQG